MKNPEPGKTSARSVLVAMSGLALATGIAGYLYIQTQYQTFDDEVHLRLLAVAQAKADQILAWRRERLGDAYALVAAAKLMPSVPAVIGGRATANQVDLVYGVLESARVQYSYENVILASLDGRIVVASGPVQGSEVYYRTMAREALAHPERLSFSDIDRDAVGGRPRLSISVALQSVGGVPFGVLILGIDPEHFLYPALREWSGAGRTGELLLARREGGRVRPLNAPRLGRGMQIPWERTSTLPTQGPQGRIDGRDYRNQLVLAAMRPVSDSDWVVIAKIDHDEAFEPQKTDAEELVLLLSVAVLLVGSIGLLFWRRDVGRLYREKYEAEVKRRELLGRYDFLARFANDGILLMDRDGRIIEANDRAFDMFGYTREEMLAAKVPDLKPSSHMSDFDEMIALVYEKKSLLFETLNRRKDGKVFPTEVSAALAEADGKVVCHSIIRDISERKATDLRIRQLNHLYMVLSACTGAIIHSDSEEELFRKVCAIAVESGGFRIAWVGKADLEAKRVSPIAKAGPEAGYLDEIEITTGDGPTSEGPTGQCIRDGRAIACVNIAEDAQMAPWREPAARHGLQSSICLPLTRSGKTVYVFGLYSSEAAFFSQEQVALAEEVGESLSFALDRLNTQRGRDQAERELRFTHERLELALDAANEAYWDWPLDGNQWYASPRYYTMLGYAPGEFALNLESLLETLHPEDREAVRLNLAPLTRGDVPRVSAEFRARCKDGHYIWVEASAKVVAVGPDGKPIRIVGTRGDITKRKVLEQEFLHAQKMETIGRLAGGVAHDFNNFLTVINGYASLLLAQLPPDFPHIHHLAAIHEAGERSAALTRQLLTFSRKGIERRELLEPNSVITGLQKMLTRLFGENVALRLELGPDAGWLWMGATQLEQVVMNLGINARDAIPQRGTVTIRTVRVELDASHPKASRAGSYVLIGIEDDGIGMDPGVQARIFEPFFTTKEKTIGTGLGLATVRDVVDAAGGFIEVDSEVGRGTAMRVYLPRAEAPDLTLLPTAPKAGPQRGTATLLVVEDEPGVRALAVEILRTHGYRVLAAENGDSAVQIAGGYKGRIDLVVTDVLMPGMNGIELVHSLLHSRPTMKVLYVSGYADASILHEELETPLSMFLPKPYTADVLLEKVHEGLAQKVHGEDIC